MLGYTGETNVQGEKVQKLDQEANETLMRILSRRGVVAAAASEEEETSRRLATGSTARYLVTFDPLDGSSNIDVNISIGTIFAVLKKTSDGPATDDDFLQKGTEIQAAGYVIYGSSTMFVITTGEGVHGFTYDPTVGEFLLSHENIRVPEKGDTYSIQRGQRSALDRRGESLELVDQDAGRGIRRPYRQRYVGTLVADAHRTLLRGGIFAYPADTKNAGGKLRLLYEANPYAFLFEAAGGAASTGTSRILDVEPTELHQRVPSCSGAPPTSPISRRSSAASAAPEPRTAAAD